ncbi:MAG: hypothetical protein P9L97_09695 [Candidatus Tenebribacter davisii]|nr:hypothetical protein [Candidatus Tenebribacter davisii]
MLLLIETIFFVILGIGFKDDFPVSSVICYIAAFLLLILYIKKINLKKQMLFGVLIFLIYFIIFFFSDSYEPIYLNLIMSKQSEELLKKNNENMQIYTEKIANAEIYKSMTVDLLCDRKKISYKIKQLEDLKEDCNFHKIESNKLISNFFAKYEKNNAFNFDKNDMSFFLQTFDIHIEILDLLIESMNLIYNNYSLVIVHDDYIQLLDDKMLSKYNSIADKINQLSNEEQKFKLKIHKLILENE